MSKRTVFLCLIFLIVSSCLALPAYQVPSITIKPREHHKISDAPKTIITQQQIIDHGAGTLSEVLQNMGGLQLQDTTGNGSQVLMSLRGFGANASSNTLLLINGIPITNPDMAPPDLNAIPLQNIEVIEVIAGSESVLYGDQAVGGLVNIKMKKQNKEKIQLFCGIGSYRQYECAIGFNHHIEAWRYHVTLFGNQTDHYRSHNRYTTERLLGQFNRSFSHSNINVYYQLAQENMQYPGALTQSQVRQNRRQANNNTDFFKDTNHFIHLKYNHLFSDTWRIEMDLARRQMSGRGILSSPFSQSRIIYFLKPQLKGAWRTIRITSGLDAESDAYHLNSTFGFVKNNQQKYSLFAFARSPLSERLLLSAGARGALLNSHFQSANINDTINRAFVTTLGITMPLSSEKQIYLRRAGSFRFPKADENASLSNDVTSLRTQHGIAYEGGITWDHKPYSTAFNLYQLNLRDEIAFDPTQTAEQPFGSNRNLSPTKRQGFSLSGSRDITNTMNLNGQYQFVNARFQNGINRDHRIPLVAENIFRAGLNYKITENLQTYFEANYIGNQYAANDDGNVAGKIGGYTTYNINLRYQIKNLSLALHLNNLLNKYYYLYTVYQANNNSESFYPAPGMNALLTMNYAII